MSIVRSGWLWGRIKPSCNNRSPAAGDAAHRFKAYGDYFFVEIGADVVQFFHGSLCVVDSGDTVDPAACLCKILFHQEAPLLMRVIQEDEETRHARFQ
jgi:hypothetical protein